MHPAATLFAVALLARALPTMGLIGYDCGGEGLNITPLSLTDIADCQIEDMEPETEEIQLQILQLSEFDHTEAIQCKIEIDRIIFYCGMHSHVSVVANGRRQYIRDILEESCRKLQDTGAISLENDAIVTNIKRNATSSVGLTLAGIIKHNGECTGATYSDPYGTWENVVVQASVQITLKNFEIPIKLSSNEVILPSGVRCRAGDLSCTDSDGVTTHWKTLPADRCQFNRYDVLYEGIAHKLTPPPGQKDSPIVYTVATKEATFALTETTESNLCGYRIIHTEHPKVFILDTRRGITFKTKSRPTADNLDMFLYINSKFVYVERHFRTQLAQLYRDIMRQKCDLERQVLDNALSLASIAPDEMASRIMKTPGYTAVTAGEAIYLIKCIPVSCKVRPTEQCYDELPVTHNNISYFLSPKSRILKRKGTPRECNELLPSMYRVEGTWYRMMPKAVDSQPPPVIRPLTQPKWKYVSPTSLATSGIYSTEDLDRLRNHIMFPVEKAAIVNTLAQGATGKTIPAGSVTLYNMLDEQSLEKIAENAGTRLWKGFMTFGSASAGIIGIFLIIRLIRLIVDSLIRGYALHSIYGWSLHLVGAVWSSITHLLIHLGSRKDQRKTQDAKIDEATLEVVVQNDSVEDSDKNKNESKSEQSSASDSRDYGDLNKYLRTTNI